MLEAFLNLNLFLQICVCFGILFYIYAISYMISKGFWVARYEEEIKFLQSLPTKEEMQELETLMESKEESNVRS